MPRQRGVFAALLAELRADAEASDEAHEREAPPVVEEERWAVRELGREDRRPVARKRSERMQALKGRRQRTHRRSPELRGLEELDPREDSLETRCVRPSLRFQAHVDVVVRRTSTSGHGGCGFELIEVEPDDDGVRAAERRGEHALVERVRVVKPAGVTAHLRILDRALVSHE